MTVAVIGILCNILLILVIIVDPLGILRKGAWVTIVNLAVADLLTYANSFVIQFLWRYFVPELEYWRISQFFSMFSMSASFMFWTLLTVQVYMIITYPIKSRLILTKAKVTLACMVVWVLALPLGLFKIANVWAQTREVLYFYIISFTILTLVVVIQVVFKVHIVVEILRSRRDDVNAETQNKKQNDLAKTAVILNVILIVAAFPYFLTKQIAYVLYIGVNMDNTTVLWQFLYYYEPVFLLNFIANVPVLYSLRLQDYRRSLLALFSCKWRKQRNNVQQPMTEMPTR